MPALVLDTVEELVRRRAGDLVELSHAIHAEPELAFAEHRSCAKTQALVAERGFEITRAAAGWTPHFGPISAMDRWWWEFAPNITRCPKSGTPAGTTSLRHRRWGPRWPWPKSPTISV
ncbi:amidohydrolase AmiB1 domain protein [Mycobacterium ulcerans str. Harvey]|uniref:Amidohydrolase AmiB1 domain protein n=1 Tax=Mycobacterium ulcerans str. Harvey TaxID=1299332 RepID=A0ABP3AIF9_MYCUL|nr:amidohydrolase AmiB1 domain protein [Mycobacterium ulcerans str. Harvey]